MKRFLLQILAGFIPLYLFSAWVIMFVQPLFDGKHDELEALERVGIGLGVMVLVEALIFKFWLLPSWARSMSMRFYAGSYIPEDDPIASLASIIRADNRKDLIPELSDLVEQDPTRARAWLELASILESVKNDPQKAVEKLIRGASCVKNDQDAAMLLWRAVSLLRKSDDGKQRAEQIREDIIRRYPNTSYGQFAAQHREQTQGA